MWVVSQVCLCKCLRKWIPVSMRGVVALWVCLSVCLSVWLCGCVFGNADCCAGYLYLWYGVRRGGGGGEDSGGGRTREREREEGLRYE